MGENIFSEGDAHFSGRHGLWFARKLPIFKGEKIGVL